jgi:NAD(P) transhydrogenase subunit alpha
VSELKLGLNLGYWGIGPAGEEALEAVQAAERAGFESVWVAESYGSDVVSVLAWLAPQTERIKLGAAIMQVPARPPAAAAMAGATIDKLSGGRFMFGFGPSGPQVSEGWYGVPYAKPWGRTREYVEIVRQIIAREGPLEHRGEHFTLPLPGGEGKALKLNFHPERNRIPVFLGAIGRKSVELAAEIADGWIPIFFSVEAFEETWGEHIEAGLRKGGRERSELEVSPTLQVAIDGDVDTARGGDAWDADVVLRVAVPSSEEIGRLRSGQVLIGHLAPLTSAETNAALAKAGVTSFAMEAIPRITRAQSMDALSSQAAAAGYAATLIGARESGRFFGMMTTAAGTVPPAKVLVLGAGVAGLQAIATAKRLGAIVTGFDIRRAAWEQIASLGGRPLELDFIPDAEGEGGYARPLTDEENEQVREALAENAARQDVIVTTAAIPGRDAPLLITAEAVRGMQPGSVIVDLAAESGGNCELTVAGETVVENGVKVAGPRNLPSRMPAPASQLYAKNLENLLGLLISEEGELQLDFDDEIVAGACITHDGEIRSERAAKP